MLAIVHEPNHYDETCCRVTFVGVPESVPEEDKAEESTGVRS